MRQLLVLCEGREIPLCIGISMVESMSVVSDILSMYQSGVTSEAQLSSSDRDRLSKREEKVKPKLRSMVAFCERVDSNEEKVGPLRRRYSQNQGISHASSASDGVRKMFNMWYSEKFGC